MSGPIDHLVTTPDAYHIVDYKTNDITRDEVESKADYYRTQMESYAVALYQNEPDKTVIATLYFTTPDEPHTLEWTPAALDELGAEIESNISGAIDTLD